MKTSNLIKYQSKNPIQKFLIKQFYKKIFFILKSKKIKSVVDIGCGEGFGMEQLYKNHIGNSYVGLDSSSVALKTAKKIHPQFKYVKGSIYNSPFRDKQFDLVMCSEVLEHLTYPDKAILELQRISKKYILISVPFEPWFRIMNFARGKYLANLGNHPEHINWWGKRSLRELLNKNLTIITHNVSLPWQIVFSQIIKNKY